MLGDDSGRPVIEGIAAWRERSAGRLAGARRVFSPSVDVSRRLERYFPNRDLTLRPHPETLPAMESLAAPLEDGESVRVAVIGTLVAIKGAERVLACAQDARVRRLPLEFHIVGSTDRDAAMARTGNVHVTGRYRESDVFKRLKTVRPHLAFLPSECPESYMFALSTAMAARLFVVCFDLGAQALRVRAWGWGQPIALERSPGEINDALIAAAQSLHPRGIPPAEPATAHYPNMLLSYYGFTAGALSQLTRSSPRFDRSRGSMPFGVRGESHAHFH
jgi:hypothetical protein